MLKNKKKIIWSGRWRQKYNNVKSIWRKKEFEEQAFEEESFEEFEEKMNLLENELK